MKGSPDSTAIEALKAQFCTHTERTEPLADAQRLTVHVKQSSPKKYRQLKAKRFGLSSQPHRKLRESAVKKIESTPSWFHPISIVQVDRGEKSVTCGSLDMNTFLQRFDQDVVSYGSIFSFAEVKLCEAELLSSKLDHFPNQFYSSVCFNLLERIVYSMATSPKFDKHASMLSSLFAGTLQASFNWTNLVDPELVPHTLSYFMELQPYFQELKELKSEVH